MYSVLQIRWCPRRIICAAWNLFSGVHGRGQLNNLNQFHVRWASSSGGYPQIFDSSCDRNSEVLLPTSVSFCFVDTVRSMNSLSMKNLDPPPPYRSGDQETEDVVNTTDPLDEAKQLEPFSKFYTMGHWDLHANKNITVRPPKLHIRVPARASAHVPQASAHTENAREEPLQQPASLAPVHSTNCSRDDQISFPREVKGGCWHIWGFWQWSCEWDTT